MPEGGRQRLLKNAVAGIAQTVVSGLTLVLLYRLLLDGVGSAGLGLWSLLMALFGLARVLEFGLSGSGMKLTAEAMAGERFGDARFYARLSILGIGLLTLPASLGFVVLVPFVVDAPDVLMWDLLVIGLGTWIGFMVQGLRSSIDAMQRVDLRHMTVSFQALAMLILCWLLIPRYGWDGLAISFLLCSCATALLTGMVLWRLWKDVPKVGSTTAIKARLRAVIQYGIPFQITTLSSQLYDPVTKYFLATFGTLADVAWYEMASRLIMQARGVLVGGLEALAPHVARHGNGGVGIGVKDIYSTAMNIFFSIGTPFFFAFLAVIPYISLVWIGSINDQFVLFSQVLALAWAVNLMSTPAYFCAQGQGKQTWNLTAHLLIAVMNVSFSYLLGACCGPVGVLLGFALALVVGSVVQMWGFHRDNRFGFEWVRWGAIAPASLIMAIAGTAFMLLGHPLSGVALEQGWFVALTGCFAAVLTMLGVFRLYAHLVRAKGTANRGS